MNVLFHIDESLKWAMVLGNIQNMIQYFDQEAMHYRIDLVANGPAVCELQDAVSEKMGFKNALLSLSSNIRICACRNALRGNHISPESHRVHICLSQVLFPYGLRIPSVQEWLHLPVPE